MRRFRSGWLISALAAGVLTGCSASPSPVRPDPLGGSFEVPAFLRPSLDVIDSDPIPAPMLDRPTGEWIRLHARGVELDPFFSGATPAQCCDANGMVRWSAAWIPDTTEPAQVQRAATILVEAVLRAQGARAAATAAALTPER